MKKALSWALAWALLVGLLPVMTLPATAAEDLSNYTLQSKHMAIDSGMHENLRNNCSSESWNNHMRLCDELYETMRELVGFDPFPGQKVTIIYGQPGEAYGGAWVRPGTPFIFWPYDTVRGFELIEEANGKYMSTGEGHELGHLFSKWGNSPTWLHEHEPWASQLMWISLEKMDQPGLQGAWDDWYRPGIVNSSVWHATYMRLIHIVFLHYDFDKAWDITKQALHSYNSTAYRVSERARSNRLEDRLLEFIDRLSYFAGEDIRAFYSDTEREIYQKIGGFRGIDYDITDVIIPGTGADGFSINLTQETITLGYDVKAYSIDGGVKWKPVKDALSAVKFPKLFNKALKLRLSDKEIDNTTKKPAAGAAIVSFADVNKRPTAPKLTINYLIAADPTGETPGEWVLAEKNGTAAVKADILIGVTDGRYVYAKWGKFFDGATNGIPVKASGGKTAYYYKSAAKPDGVAFTPASKQKKVSAASSAKAPGYKVDAKKKLIQYKANTYVKAGDATPVLQSAKGDVTNAGTYTFWIGATAKKPASVKQSPLTIAAAP